MISYLAYLFFTVSGLIFIKLSNPIVFSHSLQISGIDYRSVLGIVFYGISFLLWMGLIRKNSLTYLLPLSSAIVNILIIIAGVYIFDESLNPMKLVGILLATIGVVLMNWK